MMLADGDKRKALLMQKKKRDFDYLTTDVLMEQQKHLLASIHFKASSSGIAAQTDFIIVLPNRAIIVVVYHLHLLCIKGGVYVVPIHTFYRYHITTEFATIESKRILAKSKQNLSK